MVLSPKTPETSPASNFHLLDVMVIKVINESQGATKLSNISNLKIEKNKKKQDMSKTSKHLQRFCSKTWWTVMIQDSLCSNPPRDLNQKEIYNLYLCCGLLMLSSSYTLYYAISSYVISFMVKEVHLWEYSFPIASMYGTFPY